MARRRYQAGSVQRVNGKFKLRWREDVIANDGSTQRVHRRRTLGTIADLGTQKLARRAADAEIAKSGINSLDYRADKRATFDEFADAYERDGLSMMKPSAQASARSHIRKHLRPLLGEFELALVGTQIVQGCIRQFAEAGLGRKSIKNIIITLKSMLTAADDWGYKTAELGRTKLPPRGIATKERLFSPTEAQRIIEAAPFPFNVLFGTTALTGVRCGELLGLRWSDINFEVGVLVVTQSVWRGAFQTPKSEGSERVIPMPPQLVQLLTEYSQVCDKNKHGLLWANEAGEPYDADNVRHRVLTPLLEQLGFAPGGFHAFRHLQGTLLVKVGADPKIVQAQLGHSDIRTSFEYYAHLIADDHKKAVARVADIVMPVVPNLRTKMALVDSVPSCARKRSRA